MFAAPLSYLPDHEPDWSSTAMPTDRRCVTCGDFTATKRGKFCKDHLPSKQIAQKKASLARLETLPEREQPQAAMVSLTNEIRSLEQLAGGEQEPAAEQFCPGSGSFSGSEKAPSEAGPEVPPEAPAEASELSDAKPPEEPGAVEEAPEPISEPASPQHPHQHPYAQDAAEKPQEPISEPVSPQHPHQHPYAQDAADEPPEESSSPQHPNVISTKRADNLRRELRTGYTARGQPLTEEQARSNIAKLKRRALVMTARYRAAELAKINEFERRFVGHLTAAVDSVNAHTTAAIGPLVARSEGRIPARREGQTAAARKNEIDQALLAGRLLREERKLLVAEERAEKAAAREARPPKRRRTVEPEA
jgi:hypothetical protein